MQDPRRSRLRRSELSTPGSSPKMIAKAVGCNADVVFLDLEDAVAPHAKQGARANVVAGLTELEWGATVRACRINGVQTQWCHDDLIEVVTGAGTELDLIIVPKVRSPRDVWFVDDLLTQLECKLGLEHGRIGLEILIEETEALSCVEKIAGSSPRLEALTLGVGDLAASQGVRAGHVGAAATTHAYPGDLWHYARNRMIVAARSNGLDAIDGPFAHVADAEGYRQDATWAASLGAVGKWCIHPGQVPIANDVFAPTAAEIAEAERAVAAVDEAEQRGQGAAQLDGIMVDRASARIFAAVLDRADRCATAEKGKRPSE